MNNDIIRRMLDGIEFFTINATGESGMSKSGLAILCGVESSTVKRLVDNVLRGRAPKRLRPWQGKELNLLLTTGEKYSKRGGKVDILRADFCAAVIKHYAIEGNEAAEFSLDKFMGTGINTWIHGITGWTQADSNPAEKYFLSLILDEPKAWKEHFKPEWISEAERLTKWDWNWRCMSGFLNATVYGYFPKPMLEKLDEVNPLDEEGRRPSKQHQHFSDDADEKALRVHIDTVLTLMQVSTSLEEFWRLMNAKFSGTIQLSLLS